MTDFGSHSGEQRRHFSRILFKAPALLAGHDRSDSCEVRDLSLKGALLQVAHVAEWPLGAAVELTLSLSPTETVEIRMHGSVAHHAGAVIGIRCAEIDLDSITHLRRLVELNLGSAAALERELSALSVD
jgi:hypothetical protein